MVRLSFPLNNSKALLQVFRGVGKALHFVLAISCVSLERSWGTVWKIVQGDKYFFCGFVDLTHSGIILDSVWSGAENYLTSIQPWNGLHLHMTLAYVLLCCSVSALRRLTHTVYRWGGSCTWTWVHHKTVMTVGVGRPCLDKCLNALCAVKQCLNTRVSFLRGWLYPRRCGTTEYKTTCLPCKWAAWWCTNTQWLLYGDPHQMALWANTHTHKEAVLKTVCYYISFIQSGN